MQDERRKLNRRVSPSLGEFALQERAELLATIARYEITAENCEVLRARLARYGGADGVPNGKAVGVVLPEPIKRGDEGGSGEYGAAMIRGYNACLREVARLNSSPVSSAPSQGEQVRELPPFAQKVISKLKRFEECASDSDAGGVDIGRHWLDLLTQLGLLNRVQRSPGLWEISQQGEDVLAAAPSACSQGGDV